MMVRGAASPVRWRRVRWLDQLAVRAVTAVQRGQGGEGSHCGQGGHGGQGRHGDRSGRGGPRVEGCLSVRPFTVQRERACHEYNRTTEPRAV